MVTSDLLLLLDLVLCVVVAPTFSSFQALLLALSVSSS